MDAARGKIFAKCIREITIAARTGGGDPEANPRLRHAIERAKEANMPHENIEKAVKRGTGDLPGVSYEEFKLEGYGPGGVALLIDLLTDNRQRTVAQVRHILSKFGGNLGEAGCTAWLFSRKGVFHIEQGVDEDRLMNIVLEAGAEDLQQAEEGFEVLVSMEAFEAVGKSLEEAKIQVSSKELSYFPQNMVTISEKDAERILKLMAALEEEDDVKQVYANFDIPDDILERVAVSI